MTAIDERLRAALDPGAAPIAFLGECMVEVRPMSRDLARLGYGGDTFNSAVYLRRALDDGTDIRFVTAIGDDPVSDALAASWADERIGMSHVRRVRGSKSGLYFVHTDAAGERSFTYYRSDSAARTLFEDESDVVATTSASLVFLSGITVSLMGEAALARLGDALEAVRARGGVVAFDTNYRPAAWGGQVERAAERITAVLAHVDVALPTFSDERLLFGDRTPQESIARLHALGVAEIALKVSRDGSIVSSAGQSTHVPPVPVVEVVDTTAAGDAFNGGYLAIRLRGGDPTTAAVAGNAWGALAVQHPGAIVPIDARPVEIG